MQRRFEFMDLIVAGGLSATIVASGVLLMAANGMQISAQDALSRISTTTAFIVASLILISVFTTGLFVLSSRRAGIPQTDAKKRRAR